MRGSLIRVPSGCYHTVYALDDFNACEAINCQPMTAASLTKALKLGIREIDHDNKEICDCKSTFQNKGDEIAKEFAANQVIIQQKIDQLLISENIQNQIKITTSSQLLLKSEFKNVANPISNTSVTSRRHFSLSFSDFTESSCISNPSSSEIIICQSNHSTNSSSINPSMSTSSISSNNDDNNHNHNNNTRPSNNRTKQNKRQYKHNEVIENPSLTHIDSKSQRTFNCKGWIFKKSANRTQRLKLVICDFCPSEPPKLVDQCGLRRHLESKHSNESELNISGMVNMLFPFFFFVLRISLYASSLFPNQMITNVDIAKRDLNENIT